MYNLVDLSCWSHYLQMLLFCCLIEHCRWWVSVFISIISVRMFRWTWAWSWNEPYLSAIRLSANKSKCFLGFWQQYEHWVCVLLSGKIQKVTERITTTDDPRLWLFCSTAKLNSNYKTSLFAVWMTKDELEIFEGILVLLNNLNSSLLNLVPTIQYKTPLILWLR